MASKKVEDYAFKHGLSFGMAKRRLGRSALRARVDAMPERRGPIAGTGKAGKAKRAG